MHCIACTQKLYPAHENLGHVHELFVCLLELRVINDMHWNYLGTSQRLLTFQTNLNHTIRVVNSYKKLRLDWVRLEVISEQFLQEPPCHNLFS